MKYLVQLHEYERGWGNRLEVERLFDTPEEAIGYAKNYNTLNNTEESVPDIYWLATYFGGVDDNYNSKYL